MNTNTDDVTISYVHLLRQLFMDPNTDDVTISYAHILSLWLHPDLQSYCAKWTVQTGLRRCLYCV